jgi:hypothetical protein
VGGGGGGVEGEMFLIKKFMNEKKGHIYWLFDKNYNSISFVVGSHFSSPSCHKECGLIFI